VKITLRYQVSQNVIHQERIATGDSVGEDRSIEYDLPTLTPEERTLLLAANIVPPRNYTVSASTIELRPYSLENGKISYEYAWLIQDRVLSPAEGLTAVSALLATQPPLLEQAEQKRIEKEQEQKVYWERIEAACERYLRLPRKRVNEVYEALNYQERTDFNRDPRITQRREAWKQEDDAMKTAQTEAKQARKRAQIVAWVPEHGTPSQQERLAAGMLPDAEVVDAMRDQAFAAVTLPLYELLTKEDIEHTEDCYGERGLEYESVELHVATAVQFELLKLVRGAMPGATVSLRRHTGKCNTCDGTVTRIGILSVLTVGEFEFRREFAV